MNVSDVLVIMAAVGLTGLLTWYFFGPKKTHRAQQTGGIQTITVTVKGGYRPDVIQVAVGVPVRLLFNRQEAGDCSSRVVIPEFHVNQTLPAFATTAVEFRADSLGDYEFACGMNMIRGQLQVVAETGLTATGSTTSHGAQPHRWANLDSPA